MVDPNLLEPRDYRLTAGRPAWDLTRMSAYEPKLCNLVGLWNTWQWNQDPSLVHELFEAHSIWCDALLNLNSEASGLVVPQVNVLRVVDSP